MIRLPEGYRYAGVSAGIKGGAEQRDLGLILAENSAVIGGVFTQNRYPSAHVQYCRRLVPSSRFRALIVNSGNANAATGQAGIEDNRRMAGELARRIGVEPDQVFTASTGIIGRPFPLDRIVGSLDRLIGSLDADPSALAEAIMTTDTVAKTATAEFTDGKHRYSVVGVAKGAGMIYPNMATMLAFVMTDIPVAPDRIQPLVDAVAHRSFNCISIDGDTSTNDSFFLMAAGSAVPEADSTLFPGAAEAVTDVAVSLAKQIAADGEGAEHLIEVLVKQAPSQTIAHRVLQAVLNSNLVKTAVHGRDPNWGRILMAVGNALADLNFPDHAPLSISIQDITVFQKGEPLAVDTDHLSEKLRAPQVDIVIDLHNGSESLRGWGCDLSCEYVRINAEYST